jgi:hypothetical protein
VNDSHQAKSLDEVRTQPEKGNLREKVRERQTDDDHGQRAEDLSRGERQIHFSDVPLGPDVEAREHAGRHVGAARQAG